MDSRIFLSATYTVLAPALCRGHDCRPYWTALDPSKTSAGAMIAHDDGNGPAIYTTGFANPGFINPVRRWDGFALVPLGSGLAGEQSGLYQFDDGSGNKVYFRTITGGVINMWRWNGKHWEAIPEGMISNVFPKVEPRFSTAQSGIEGLYGFMVDEGQRFVCRWEGNDWKRLGATGAGNGLDIMAEYFDRGQWNLLVSGTFFDFAGLPARKLVRWDGLQWHEMGKAPAAARSIVTWDDGTGPSLYVGYIGIHEQTLPRQGIARWTGTQWVSVGGGVVEPAAQVGRIDSMVVFDDGTGPALFVAGAFSRAGGMDGIPARNIAKWDGRLWHALGLGVGGFVNEIALADDGRGPSLFVSGSFVSCGGGTARYIAQYVGCANNRQCYPDCDNTRSLTANDFMCFLNKYAIKDPYANCDLSTAAPAINAADFQCYLNKFAQGCSLP